MSYFYRTTHRGYVIGCSFDEKPKLQGFTVTIGTEVEGQIFQDKQFAILIRPMGNTGPTSQELFDADVLAKQYIDQVLGFPRA